MPDPVEKPPDPVEKPFDAFISYASVDRRRARRVQRFLDSWVDRREGRRLRVFLDETDIRGGSLDEELRRAVHGARTLIICHSQAAADSRWVQREVRLFRERAEPGRIAVAIVSGKEAPEVAGRELVAGAEFRVHDLRRGWWLGRIGLGVKLELLRLLAFVAEADMRRLRNWHLRRTLAGLFLFAMMALLPLWALLSARLNEWEQLELKLGAEPLFAIAAEADGERLTVASRYRGSGPQGFRDYIQIASDALAENRRSPSTRFVHPAGVHRDGTQPSANPHSGNRYRRLRARALKPLVSGLGSRLIVSLAPTEENRRGDGSFARPRHTDSSRKGFGRRRRRKRAADRRGTIFRVWNRAKARRTGIPSGSPCLVAGRDMASMAAGIRMRRAGCSSPPRAEQVRAAEVCGVQSSNRHPRRADTFGRVAEKHAELWRGIRLVPRSTVVMPLRVKRMARLRRRRSERSKSNSSDS
jgi:hypothetical protein